MTQKQLVKCSFTYGAVLGVTLSLIEFLAFFLGLLFKPQLINLFTFVVLISLYFALVKNKKHLLDGVKNFFNVFLFCFLMFVFSGAIWALYKYIQYTLNPQIVTEIVISKEVIIRKSIASVSKREQLIQFNRSFMTPLSLVVINTFMISMVIGGSILSLFLAFVLNQIYKRQTK